MDIFTLYLLCSTTTHRSHYPPKKLVDPEPLSRAPWQPDAPAPTYFLETLHKASYPGWPVGPPETLGVTKPERAKVPFLGKTTYAVTYTPKTGGVQEKRVALSYPASADVHFDGRTIASQSFKPYAHLPGGDMIQFPDPVPAHLQGRPKTDAPLEGETQHMRDYPPYPGARPAPSAKRPQVAAAADAPFVGISQTQDIHRQLALPNNDENFKPGRGEGYIIPQETRDFSTQQVDDFPPRPIPSSSLCPASRLPAPPSPNAAPTAWEGQHVLWDTQLKRWAV